MAATPLTEVGLRLVANVEAGHADYADSVMLVPPDEYRDPARFAQELEAVFRRSPLLVALSCDIPNPGDFTTMEIAGRPIVVIRGADGVVRTLLNACLHRGRSVMDGDPDGCFGSTKRLTCPYHAWIYDIDGTLIGTTDRDGFAGEDLDGLVQFPTEERAGAVFSILTVGARLDLDEWLGDMASALEMLRLDELHRHDVETSLPSGNWKATADGYLDGYHLGYLHRSSIGAKSITNRNTYDLWGPHVRIAFANKPIREVMDRPVEEWGDLYERFSLVHYVFPNISISGHPDKSLMVSRIYPGPSADECRVVQYQYFRQPLDTADKEAEAEAKRQKYAHVTYEEDFVTVMDVTRRVGAMVDAGLPFRFGRNEMGNQNLHNWVAKLLADL
jgi:phenylpropionate dioxygenase-like ring-hydroxylating dioxygenase large terminal subunit